MVLWSWPSDVGAMTMGVPRFRAGWRGVALPPVWGDAQVPRGAAGMCRAPCNRGSGGLPYEDVPRETALP